MCHFSILIFHFEGGDAADTNGKWQMANGKWQMANGKWQMRNEK